MAQAQVVLQEQQVDPSEEDLALPEAHHHQEQEVAPVLDKEEMEKTVMEVQAFLGDLQAQEVMAMA